MEEDTSNSGPHMDSHAYLDTYTAHTYQENNVSWVWWENAYNITTSEVETGESGVQGASYITNSRSAWDMSAWLKKTKQANKTKT